MCSLIFCSRAAWGLNSVIDTVWCTTHCWMTGEVGNTRRTFSTEQRVQQLVAAQDELPAYPTAAPSWLTASSQEKQKSGGEDGIRNPLQLNHCLAGCVSEPRTAASSSVRPLIFKPPHIAWSQIQLEGMKENRVRACYRSPSPLAREQYFLLFVLTRCITVKVSTAIFRLQHSTYQCLQQHNCHLYS